MTDVVNLAEKLAKQWVCPYAKNFEPQTVYEYNTVKAQTRFAMLVIDEYKKALLHEQGWVIVKDDNR